ncbi:MAG: proton-conducting transporter membrane subunit [Desulfobacterales bacterium]|nr:proton-conducting transporter membrane subunit [Desulfobacterales bacterium]
MLEIALLAHPRDRRAGAGGRRCAFRPSFALTEKDVKRLLASSTLSQIGFMLAAPAAGAFYALSMGW